jgi:hypothetical protein
VDTSTDPDEPIGLEFAADGKRLTLVAPGGGRQVSEVSLNYTLLENGRARLTAPGNEAMSFTLVLKVNGDRLTVEPESQNPAFDRPLTFARLSGQSIAQRHQDRIKEIAAERQAQQKKVLNYLAQPGLAIVPADGGGAGSFRLAMELKGGDGNWQGTGYHEVAGGIVARQVQVTLAPQPDGSAGAAVTLGPVVGPPGARPMQPEQFQFAVVTKPDGSLDLTGQGRALRVDADANKSLSEKYQAALKAQRELIDQFHAKVGQVAILEGEVNAPNAGPNQKPLTARIALLRVDGKDAYMLADARPGVILMPSSFNRPAAVELIDGKPVLRGQGGEVIVPASSGDGAFDVQTQGRAGTLKVVKRFTAEELAAHRAKLAAVVAGMKDKPVDFVGTFYQSYTYEQGYARPARFSLGSSDGKQLAGTFACDAINVSGKVAGQVSESLLGLVFKIGVGKPTGQVPGGRFDEGGTFTMELQLDGGVPRLAGRVDPGDGANKIELTAAAAAWRATLREKLMAELKAGGKFAWSRTGSTGTGDECLGLELADAGDGKLTGTASFRPDRQGPRTGPVTGQIKEVDGLLVLELNVGPGTEPKRTVATGPLKLYVVPFGDSIQLSGGGTWDKQTYARYASYAPAKP